MVLCLDSPQGKGELIPVFIVNGKRAAASPFRLVKVEAGRFEVWKDNARYSEAIFIPKPGFYNKINSANVPMSKVAVIVGPGHLRSVANQKCLYQQNGEACKFCAVQYWWNAISVKQSSQIAEAIAEGYRDGAVKHVSLTTATLDTPDRGLANLVETVKLSRTRADIPFMIEFEPLTDHGLLKELLQEAKKWGVTTVSINIECFDPGLRLETMPAKGKIPVAQYYQNWQICLDIFGRNQVSTVVVVGIGEDDKATFEGVERAASQGVLTFLVPHSPAAGAVYEDMQPPSADRMLRLYQKAVDVYNRYNLDLCSSASGCIRGGGFSAIKDVARFGI
jgi:radical SAM protein (TIGR04043 family)